MKREFADYTVGDVGNTISLTAPISMTGKNIDLIFTKPSGETILRDATSNTGYTATYTFASGDIDEAGIWHVDLRNVTDGYDIVIKAGSTFKVREKPEDMAVM